MDHSTVAAIVVVAALIVIAAIVISYRVQRSRRLMERFGMEYDHAVLQKGRAKGEFELLKREKHIRDFAVKALSPAARDRYIEEWGAVQRRFVGEPGVAVTEADELVNRVMNVRGYPMAEFEQHAADISVTCPDVVENYRAARFIALRQGRGKARTEDLGQAMVHYRFLFEELLDLPASASGGYLHERAS